MVAVRGLVSIMIHITEEQSAAVASHEMAFTAVRAALIAAATPEAASFPVVLGHGSDPQNRFTVKSSADGQLAGLKVGSYFPRNDAQGLPRHRSTIFLFDQTKGRIGAVIEGSLLNAYRTAAADAVATDALARADATVLAIFGTGHQAEYEVAAVVRIRPLTRILVVGRDPSKVLAFVEALRAQGLPAEAAAAEDACRAADIIVTATTAARRSSSRTGSARARISRPWGRMQPASRSCRRSCCLMPCCSPTCPSNRCGSESSSMRRARRR